MKKQNMTPLVSIVTPSYNQGKYIEKTIQSVLDQDYPSIEYTVIDGGSSDNTIDILKKYEDRLQWISEQDEGQADAVNKGFNGSHGEILAWLNSDDTYLPGAVSRIVKYFNANPDAGMVYGKSHFIDDAGKIVGEYPTEPFDHKRLATFNFICQPSVFFTRDAYFNSGGLDLNLNYAMDYDLWLRMVRRCKPIYLDEFLSTYRLHAESKSIAGFHTLKTNEECLKTVMKYYKWAPANRVYACCYHRIREKTPPSLLKINWLTSVFVFLVSLVEYVRLNKGLNTRDLKMIKPSYIKKLIKGWEIKDMVR